MVNADFFDPGGVGVRVDDSPGVSLSLNPRLLAVIPSGSRKRSEPIASLGSTKKIDRMQVEFSAIGLPPKKDGSSSMWGKASTELVRIQDLRRSALAKIGTAGPFRRNITLDIEVYAPGSELPQIGDLDNFIAGVCDGLMRAAGIQKDVHWEGNCWEGIQPCEAVGIEDDAHVVSIVARKVADSSNGRWYKIVLSGER